MDLYCFCLLHLDLSTVLHHLIQANLGHNIVRYSITIESDIVCIHANARVLLRRAMWVVRHYIEQSTANYKYHGTYFSRYRSGCIWCTANYVTMKSLRSTLQRITNYIDYYHTQDTKITPTQVIIHVAFTITTFLTC